jgi:hypothetical protein
MPFLVGGTENDTLLDAPSSQAYTMMVVGTVDLLASRLPTSAFRAVEALLNGNS